MVRSVTHHQELVGRVQQMDGATELGDHATHVGGTMIAAGVLNTAHGMAHEAQLHAYEWGNDDSEMATAAANGLGMSNHSYGWYLGWRWNYFDDDRWAWFGDLEVDSTEDYKFGFYNEAARDWDIIAYNAPYYLIVHSAGNERNDSASPGRNTGSIHQLMVIGYYQRMRVNLTGLGTAWAIQKQQKCIYSWRC